MFSVGCDLAIRVPRTGVQLSGPCSRNQRGARHPVGEIHHRCANFRILQKCTLRNWGGMGCCLVVLVLMFPRVVLLVLFLFSTYLERAYHGLVIPLLGFLFLPLTTLAYAWMINTHMPIEGVNLLILVVAAVIDAGGLGGGEYHRRRR